jgi:NADH-quinone oxidoreductase subunit L
VLAVHAAELLGAPEGRRFLYQHLWQCVRVGPVDIAADLALDPLAAVVGLVVAVSGTVFALRAPARDPGAWRASAWLGALVAALLVTCLADNFALLFVGWHAAGLSAFGLTRASKGGAAQPPAAAAAFVSARVSDVAFVLGVALLFWGLGGGWDRAGEYQSDLSPRLAAVSVAPLDVPVPVNDPSMRGGAATQGKGWLTVEGLPDSLVYLDDSRTPLLDADGLPLRTPFHRHELAGGVHSVRVAPDDTFHSVDRDGKASYLVVGGVLTNYTVGRLAFGADREVAIAVLGPSLRFRELADALALVDAKGDRALRNQLVARKVAGVGLFTVVATLLAMAGIARAAVLAPHLRAGAAVARLGAAGMLVAGGTLLARVAFLFALPHVALVSLPVSAVVVALVLVAARPVVAFVSAREVAS